MSNRKMHSEEKEKIINAIGSSWDDFERETFTPEEIAGSNQKVEQILQRYNINGNTDRHKTESKEETPHR